MNPTLRVQSSNRLALCFIVVSSFVFALQSQGQTLITNWTVLSGTVSGATSANPVFGNGSTVANTEIYTNVGGYSLAVGDAITFSGTFTMTGNSTSAADQLRIGMLYSNGSSNNIGLLGYWFGNADATTIGTLREKTSPASAVDILSTSGTSAPGFASTGVAFTSTGSYTFSISYLRTASNALSISWLLSNGGTYVLTKSISDTTVVSGFTFDTVGILTGGGVNATQISFSNLAITYVPEPSTWALVGIAGLPFLVLAVRKRRAAPLA